MATKTVEIVKISRIDDMHLLAETDHSSYVLTDDPDFGLECPCVGHAEYGRKCKHIKGAEDFIFAEDLDAAFREYEAHMGALAIVIRPKHPEAVSTRKGITLVGLFDDALGEGN